MEATQTRDIIVVGSSTGGIAALSLLARQLPEDLPASVFVVQHTAQESPGLLGEILSRQGSRPAIKPKYGMEMERGRIYVAPPSRHRRRWRARRLGDQGEGRLRGGAGSGGGGV